MSEIKDRKKKKKRSFMQQMKKNVRKGNQKQGQKLPDDEFKYYFGVYEQLKNIEKDGRGIFIMNILEQMIEDKKVRILASHQLVSRILDEILPEATTKTTVPIMDVFSEDLRIVCVDPYSSHVLQTLITIAFRNIQEGATETVEDPEEKTVPIDNESKKAFHSFLLKVSKYIYNNLGDFILNVYASYVIRTVLEVCSGVTISNSVKCSRKAQTFHSMKDDVKMVVEVPEDLTSVGHKILERMKRLPQFPELIKSECGSAVLQTALLTLSGCENNERLISFASHIIEHGFMKLECERGEINPIFTSHPTCRLMEALVPVLPEEKQELIYGAFFRDHMTELVQHEIGHHAVEKLFASWKSKDSFPSMLSAHTDCLKEALLNGQLNKVLFCAVQSCRRLNSCQPRITKILMEILECYEPENLQSKFAPLLLYLLKWKDYEERKRQRALPPISAQGTFLIQEFLRFNKPIKIVRSILEMSSSELHEICRNPRGSHIIDAFTSAPNVGEASKIKLFKKLKGHYVSLACSKHGSYSLEHIWNILNVKLKTELANELYDSSNQLKENQFGRIIYFKFKLQHFSKQEILDWQEHQEKAANKKLFLKRMLEETTDESSITPTKKKNKSCNK